MNCTQEIMGFRKVHTFVPSTTIKADPDVIDYVTSENPAEHKSHNLIELNNGQYACIQTTE